MSPSRRKRNASRKDKRNIASQFRIQHGADKTSGVSIVGTLKVIHEKRLSRVSSSNPLTLLTAKP